MQGNSLSEHAKIVVENRYSQDSEDWEKITHRVGFSTAQAEVAEDRDKYGELFTEIIYNLQFLPGGRILRGVGRPRANLLNCFVLDVDDSMKSLGQCLNKMWEISSEGGGVGINFSKIRPSGEILTRKGGIASGPISFMKVFDVAASVICSGGARRAALKADLNISHPDIVEFMSAKIDNNELNNFNISVAVTNQFLDAVRKGKSWELRWGGKTYRKTKARDLWMSIMDYACKCGEPGIINLDSLVQNNSFYFANIVSTNPCGELPLETEGSCCLGHINLAKFVKSGRTQWQEMEKTIQLAVRFLDNIIDINYYFLKDCQEAAYKGRRIGLGILGLADYFFMKEITYGSEKCIEELDNLFAFFRNISYATSIELAKEKGAFPAFDRELYCKAKFIRRIPRHLQRKIYNHAIRNVTLNTVAPTGTVHQIADVTSGCEPLFSKAYRRNDQIGERAYVHPLYLEHIINKTKIPEWYVDAFDITPYEHLEVQATIQRYIDGSIAKTINCPKGTDAKALSTLILRYIDEIKGLTVYVDGSREEQILYPMDEKEVRKLIKEKDLSSFTKVLEGDVECRSGVCEI